MDKIKKNPMLSGVTFSGGEPLLQPGTAASGTMITDSGLDLAIYTGYTFEELLDKGDNSQLELLSLANVLIDGPLFEQRSLSLNFRGSANQRILNIKESLAQGRAVLETNQMDGLIDENT